MPLDPRLPESTYRLQFHAKFRFVDATAIVPYLAELGVTHAYASPYLKAAPGSTHGYDVIDHNALNPEVGTAEEYDGWTAALASAGLSHILDTVPNHVGVATNENAWWNDLLEDGRASPYADHFDITWRDGCRAEMCDRLLLPVLGGRYGDVLERGELTLRFEPAEGWLFVSYYDRRFPISPAGVLDVLGRELGDAARDLQELPPAGEARVRRKHEIRRALAGDKALGARLANAAERYNGTPGNPRAFDALDRLLNAQNYRLAWWRTAAAEINYRRFFEINDLAALRMERDDVFRAAHALTMRLIAEGKVTGLRVDHPDGLRDPEAYLRRLQQAYDEARGGSGDGPLYVVVEKILAADESPPRTWPCNGTTGYDFLIKTNGLFVDPAGEAPLTRVYERLTGESRPFDDVAYEKKRAILRASFGGELTMLVARLDRLAQQDRCGRDFSALLLRDAASELIACFPVYRTYIVGDTVSDEDRARIEEAVETAKARNPNTEAAVFDYVREVLLLRRPEPIDDALRALRLEFIVRFQQLTAPVTAKGVEDTAFYVYHRLDSLNEVGGDPGRFGTAPDALHAYYADRQRHWPHALSALSTHDTKRSEDVRARIDVLSEIPDRWADHVTRWYDLNRPQRTSVNGAPAPAPNDEYLLYQTLVGAWPLGEPDGSFTSRIQAYMTKAMREAKTRTSWTSPDEAYENAVCDFVAAILDSARSREFLADFVPFQREVSQFGLINSLAQTLLRLTAPGVPDTYHGTELWDFSLVDPDNRRPVDYARRRQMLAEIRSRGDRGPNELAPFANELLRHREDGRLKLYLTWRMLTARRDNPDLFSEGDYVPLPADGPHADNVFAFLRRHGGRTAIVVVPRLTTRLARGANSLPVGASAWADTRLRLPDLGTAPALQSLFTRVPLPPSGALADVFRTLPVAVFL